MRNGLKSGFFQLEQFVPGVDDKLGFFISVYLIDILELHDIWNFILVFRFEAPHLEVGIELLLDFLYGLKVGLLPLEDALSQIDEVPFIDSSVNPLSQVIILSTDALVVI